MVRSLSPDASSTPYSTFGYLTFLAVYPFSAMRGLPPKNGTACAMASASSSSLLLP